MWPEAPSGTPSDRATSQREQSEVDAQLIDALIGRGVNDVTAQHICDKISTTARFLTGGVRGGDRGHVVEVERAGEDREPFEEKALLFGKQLV